MFRLIAGLFLFCVGFTIFFAIGGFVGLIGGAPVAMGIGTLMGLIGGCWGFSKAYA